MKLLHNKIMVHVKAAGTLSEYTEVVNRVT